MDPHFTKESDSTDPQWMMFSFPDKAVSVDTLKIAWGVPYAIHSAVQYWVGQSNSEPIGTPQSAQEHWQDFPSSAFSSSGGDQVVRLAAAPIDVVYVRVQLAGGSATAPPGSKDLRDQLGFSVREVSLGHGAGSGFVDVVSHKPECPSTHPKASGDIFDCALSRKPRPDLAWEC